MLANLPSVHFALQNCLPHIALARAKARQLNIEMNPNNTFERTCLHKIYQVENLISSIL